MCLSHGQQEVREGYQECIAIPLPVLVAFLTHLSPAAARDRILFHRTLWSEQEEHSDTSILIASQCARSGQ